MTKIDKPPLIKFNLRFNFEEIKLPNFQTLSTISDYFMKMEYINPKIKIMPSRQITQPILFSPITYFSKQEDCKVNLYSDSIIFDYDNKYTRWREILPVVLDIFKFVAEKLQIENIQRISIDYIDNFMFNRHNFKIKNYFKIDLGLPNDFDMNFSDFIIGLKENIEDPDHVSILRLRGLKPKNEKNYNIQLETHYAINKEIQLNDDLLEIEQLLNKSHKHLVTRFINFLTSISKEKIEYQEDE